jgi:pilus assembly protein FimV
MPSEMREDPSGEKKLEQYGVWVKVGPQEFTSPQTESAFGLTDLESPAEAGPVPEIEESTLTQEEEELLDELETEITQDESPAAAEVPASQGEELEVLSLEEPSLGSEEPGSEPLEELSDISLEIPSEDALPELEIEESRLQESESVPEPSEETLELPKETISEEIAVPMEEQTAEVEVPLSEKLPEEERFDDLAALEEEIATAGETASGAVKMGGAVSMEVLARIEEEMKSIRADLSQLKKELMGMKKSGKAEREGEAEAAGFFDEDEDETIALTGDELDNILSTAEITEESAEVSAPEEHGEAASVAELGELAGGEDILSYETGTEQAPIEGGKPGILEPITDTLVLEGEETPSAEPGPELELDLGGEPISDTLEGAPSESSSADLDIELEALPELEEAGEGAPEGEMEPMELEALEPSETPAPEPLDLEAIPEIESVEETPAEKAAMEDIGSIEGLQPEESMDVPKAEDLELEAGELETLGPGEGEPEKEISLDLEALAEETQPTEEASAVEEAVEVEELPSEQTAPAPTPRAAGGAIPEDLKDEIKTVLKYMDQLLEALPEEKIQEFAGSEYFVMYKKLFEDLGLGE